MTSICCFLLRILFFLTLFSGSLVAQVSERTTLFDQLEVTENDSSRAVLLNSVAKTYARQQPDSAIHYFNQALLLSASLNTPLFQTNTLSFMSMTYSIWGKQDSAKIQLEAALDICIDNGLDSALHQVYFGLGNVVESQGDIRAALKYYYKALEYFEEKEYFRSLNRTKANISYIHLKTGEYVKAHQLILESNRYYESVGASRQLINGYSRLGTFFSKTQLPDSAIFYLEKAKKIAISTNADFELAKLYLITGSTMYAMRDYEPARANLLLAVGLMGINQAEPGDLLNALTLLILCNEILEIGDNDYLQTLVKAQLVNTQDAIDIRAYYENMSKIDSVKGDFKSSLQYFKKFQLLKDSLFNKEVSGQLLEIETKYETQKMKAEKIEAENMVSLAQAENERNKLLFIGIVVVIFLIGISILFYYSKQKQKRKAESVIQQLASSQKQLALEKQYRDSELKALKAQMNPHFIFNVLNSIQEYIMLNDKANASDYLSMFSHLIRSYLDQSGKKSISLQEETETLNRYLQLEALRFGEDFSTRIEIDEKLDQETTEIPPMIIQPYVENAIKHGLFNKEGVKTLNIVMQKNEDGFLRCVIHDNGIGRKEAAKIKASKPTLHESFAIAATQSRMELYNLHSASKISVEVNDLYDNDNIAIGTKVTILIPLQS